MKIQIAYYIVLLLLGLSCQKKISQGENITINEVDSLVSEGLHVYASNPKDAVVYFREAGVGYESLDSYKNAGITFLNVAGMFEEHLSQMDSAEYYAFRSLENFLLLKDSLQIANLYKYYGYLLGINGRLEEGESYIDRAIQIYKRSDFDEGIAVSKYNLARLAFLKKDYSRSDSLLSEARTIWVHNNDISRLFLINLLNLEIGIETKNRNSVLEITGECDSLLLIGDVPEVSQSRYRELKARI